MKEFLKGLSEEDAAAVAAAMNEVREQGLRSAKHLRGEIYEVRTSGNRFTYRLLFAPQGRQRQVLLTLVALRKKTQKTPSQITHLAQQRLRDWERIIISKEASFLRYNKGKKMTEEPDVLDELIAERTARNPDFPKFLKAAERRRALLGELAAMRERRSQSQTAVAAEMKTSQSSVARLEGSAGDARLSTIDRYAEALGFRVQWHLLPLEGSEGEPPVVVHAAS
ncbi:MAG: type II toxin-antitoxin system RelE/ParE family toxin [Solirubrobacterales bacterium]